MGCHRLCAAGHRPGPVPDQLGCQPRQSTNCTVSTRRYLQIPIFRLLLNNWMGLGAHILYMAWCAAAGTASLPASHATLCLGRTLYYQQIGSECNCLPASHKRAVHPTHGLHPTSPPCLCTGRRVSAAFYATVTWLPAQLRDAGLKPIVSQGIVM